MKKYRYLLAIVLSIVLITSFYLLKVKSEAKFKEMDLKRVDLLYQQPFIDYFGHRFECPSDIQDVLVGNSNDPDYSIYINRHFKDFLSKKRSGFVSYIPLYNPCNLKREGFVILSTGIDGYMNNHYSNLDTLFITDFYKKLKLYNPEDFYKIGDTIKLNTNWRFNLMNYFFGKKDYLIEYINCIEVYKLQARNLVSLEKVIRGIRRHRIRRRIIQYEGINPVDTIVDGIRYVYFMFNGYLIKSQMYSGCRLNVNSSDSIRLIGTLKEFDEEKKDLDFCNCIQLNSD